MNLRRGAVAAALLVLAGPALVGAAVPAVAPAVRVATAAPPLSSQARELHAWVLGARDNEGAPFAVIDKRLAQLWLFDARGRRVGSTPVLLGAARGDASVPGIGERPMQQILPHERTTPAGRFITEPGHNAQGEDILWVDYNAAVSMHRVRATNPVEQRLQRLASRTPVDNRISYGCINVPAAFYDRHLRPRFTQARGVVYLLPETLPLKALFHSDPTTHAVAAHTAAAPIVPVLQALLQPPPLTVSGRRVAFKPSSGPAARAPVLAQRAEPTLPTAEQARGMALLFARPASKPLAPAPGRQALKTKTPPPA